MSIWGDWRNAFLYPYICTQRVAHTHMHTFYLLLFCPNYSFSLTHIRTHTHTHTRARPLLPAHFCCHRFASFISIRSFEHLPLLPLLLLRLLPSSSSQLLLFSLLYSHRKYYDFITFAHSFCITCAFTHLPNCLAACSAMLSHMVVPVYVCMPVYVCQSVCVLSETSTHQGRHMCEADWAKAAIFSHLFQKQVVRF